MERDGEAAGGRSMQRLILCVCVFVCAGARQAGQLVGVCMYLFSTFARTYFVVLHMVQKLLGAGGDVHIPPVNKESK